MNRTLGLALFLLTAIVPIARSDIRIDPVAGASLLTDITTTPPTISMQQQPGGYGMEVYTYFQASFLPNPNFPTFSRFNDTAIVFDLNNPLFQNLSIRKPELALTTTFFYNAGPYPHVSSYFNVSYGIDTTADFTASNFFGSAIPGGVVGVARIPLDKINPVIRFDLTTIIQYAQTHPEAHFLKIWIHPPNGGTYWRAMPTIQVVPEPSTVVLLGTGLLTIGLLGSKSWLPRRAG